MLSSKILHAAVGLILLMAGILFDFLYLQTRMSAAFRTDAVTFLNSFEKQLLDLTRTYAIVFGLIHLALAALRSHASAAGRMENLVFWLTAAGALVIVGTGLWYAKAGPSFQWEPRCTVLTAGILAFVMGLAIETYRILASHGE